MQIEDSKLCKSLGQNIMSDFVHLHNHSHYSLLDAIATLKQDPKKAKANMDNYPGLIDKAVADGHKAIALTDHGVMFGAVSFYKAAKAAGIKPIIGMEAYITNLTRSDRALMKFAWGEKKYFHILLLAKNNIGYKNLVKLTSLAHTEGFYYKPRIDKELLEKYHEGLICTTACVGGIINYFLVNGDYDTALKEAKWYKDLFGDDFYIELQNHGLPEDEIILRDAPKIAKAIGAKLVATNDIHYIDKDDAVAHNVLLAIKNASSDTNNSKEQKQKSQQIDFSIKDKSKGLFNDNANDIKDNKPNDVSAEKTKPAKEKESSANGNSFNINNLGYKVPEFYFKTAAEMKELFRDFPEAIESTVEIAEKCNVEIELGKLHMPSFDIPIWSKSKDLDEYLKEETYRGLEKRFGADWASHEEIKQRADYELGVIKQMQFPGYFLITWDFIRAAHERGVRVGPGRGSAAGSLVAFALEITNIDPLKYDLLFERFLNPERVSMPDIDIDFQDDLRDKVIEYCKEKYGEKSIAQIITFGKLTSKAVLTDVGRVLGVPLRTIKKMTKNIPSTFGKVMPLTSALELADLKKFKEDEDENMKQLIEYSLKLEYKNRNSGIHAAGVVIAPGDVTNYVPVYTSGKTKEQSVDIATQYSMNELEEAGLLKMDFLGLRTLSIIDNTIKMVKKNYGIDIDIDNIDLEETKTYELLSSGKTVGIFQFESDGMTEYLRKLRPRNMEELAAMNALYRPGPMKNIPEFIDRKHDRKPIEYLHPIMKSVLDKTQGIIVYQEQVMKLVQVVANFSLGQADILRRAMGKKKVDIMTAMKGDFIEGAAKNGINKHTAEKIFDLIFEFANYGFNKSHAIAYSYLAYQTAWLKAHYPAEFLAANMTAEINKQKKIVKFIDEANKLGIEVLPPDVNRSEGKFKAIDGKIYFGMAGIRNVGLSAVESIVEARKEAAFTSIFDLCARLESRVINRRTLEALVCAGAFDSLNNGHRAQLYEAIEMAIAYSKKGKVSLAGDMNSLFASGGDSPVPDEPLLPDVQEWSDKARLSHEKEYLNFYVSGHPLKEYEVQVKSFINLTLAVEPVPQSKDNFRVAGIITDIRLSRDKKDNPIAFVTLEDFTYKAEIIFWADSFKKYRHLLEPDKIIFVNGKVSPNEEKLKILASEVTPLEESVSTYAKGLKIWIDLEKEKRSIAKMIDSIIRDNNQSKSRIDFFIKNRSGEIKSTYRTKDYPAKIDIATVSKLSGLLGNDNVRYITE